MSSPVEQIKEKLDIVSVVGSYIKLDRAGGNFRARCPFHNEKTPSFMVSPDRGSYHCFGCNKGGDMFSFVEEIEGTDFPGALRVLADRAGVVLTRENPAERNERDRLFMLLSDATLFYRKELRKNTEAIQYLRKRGLLPATMDEFQIGFAPNDWHVLENYLLSRGYTPIEMEKTGMSIRGEKGMYDRFRSRIMFPLCDSSGRVVGFTGRVFQSDDPAKYVNSPETPLYNKSKILFGLSLAKTAIREAGAAILVEGQMDLIMAHQSGTKNSVAVSGTALTGFHLEMLKRFADKLLFSFDSDDAGLNAAKKSAIPGLQMGFDVHAIELSGEKDPADLILESPEKWKEAITSARHIVEFFLSVLQKKSADKRAFRLSVEKNVLPIVANIESKIDQAHFVDVIAAVLDVSRDAVYEELRKVMLKQNEEASPYEKEEIAPIQKRMPASRREAIEKKIRGVILWQQASPEPSFSPEELQERYKTIAGLVREIEEQEKNALIFEAEAFYSGTASIRNEIEDLFLNFEKEVIKDSLTEAMNELRRAELLHDSGKAAELLGTCKVLSEKLNKLNASK
ncbi:MAG: DNA primase [Candidatus Parcubacteria bacterium]|nr:DNA primase [Candidatus Parcubacteria bacterium]